MLLLTDRTTLTTDDECRRRRYWYKEAEGGGIVPLQEAIELIDGIDFHHDLALVAEGKALDEILALIPNPAEDAPLSIRERWARRVGSVVAFHTWVWPTVSKDFKVEALEGELILDRKPLLIATTPDAVLRHRRDNYLVVDDYKSFSGWDTTSWANHWPYAVQMHILLAAVAEEWREPVKYARVRGIVKGRKDKGLLRHPYVWAYSNGEAVWQEAWKAGLELRPTWEYPGGPAAYAGSRGLEVGMGLFPLSQPIFLNDTLLKQCVIQVMKREEEIQDWRAGKLSLIETFPGSFERCRPIGMGRQCPYLEACWNSSVGADPLGSGLYARRKPHHELELINLEDDHDEAD